MQRMRGMWRSIAGLVITETVSWCVSLYFERMRETVRSIVELGLIMEKVSWSLSCTVGTRH